VGQIKSAHSLVAASRPFFDKVKVPEFDISAVGSAPRIARPMRDQSVPGTRWLLIDCISNTLDAADTGEVSNGIAVEGRIESWFAPEVFNEEFV